MGVYIIAEVGNTHEGSLGLAECFIKAAAECGVNAVKFQTHIFDAESLPEAPNPPYFKDETRKQYFDRTGFDREGWAWLKRCCAEHNVDFLSSPFSIEAVELLESIGVDSYKIASGEVSNLPLLEVIGKTKKRVFLSSGMSSLDDLDSAVQVLQENGCSDLTVLVCTSEYPCPPEKSGLKLLDFFAKRYECPVGFSDHTLGNASAITSVPMRAGVIEKHFTLSTKMYGPDPQFSATPEELSALVEGVRAAELACESFPDLSVRGEELGHMKRIFEKSIVSARNIRSGERITMDDLCYKKPGDGVPAREYKKVIGMVALQDIAENVKVQWEMFSE